MEGKISNLLYELSNILSVILVLTYYCQHWYNYQVLVRLEYYQFSFRFLDLSKDITNQRLFGLLFWSYPELIQKFRSLLVIWSYLVVKIEKVDQDWFHKHILYHGQIWFRNICQMWFSYLITFVKNSDGSIRGTQLENWFHEG